MRANGNILAAVLLVAGLSAVDAGARTLGADEALARVTAGQGGSAQGHMRARANNMSLSLTTLTPQGEPAVYVFEKAGDKGGFMLVSASDCAYPLLGYSDKGTIPADTAEMAPALRWWLDEYARQIEWAEKRGVNMPQGAVRAASAERPAIAPMLKTSWDQEDPYNRQCPTYGADRTYTGCVATAMAQVLNYWKYPEKGTGSISYNAETIQKRLSLNFGLRKFDWENMLPTYANVAYTDAQADAVAYLMKACGYAVKMDYGTNSSGAMGMSIAKGLTKYLGYDGNIQYEVRHFYTATQWNDMIYENLRDVGPVLYGGGSMLGGGHSFVCDGYDGQGLFHFNWGWTGMSDGYFALDALNPYALGAGGGTGGGYNFTQDAVLGIQPPTGKPVAEKKLYLTQQGSLAGVVNGSTVSFDLFAEAQCMWVNYNPDVMHLAFEVKVEKTGDASFVPVYAPVSDKRYKVDPGYGTDPAHLEPALDMSTLNLSDGTYRLTMVTYDTEAEGDDVERVPVRPCLGYVNYIDVTKSGDTYTVVNQDVDRMEIVSGKILGNYYYGMSARVQATIGNDSQTEMSRGIAPAILVDGKVVLLGESLMISLKPGETVTREWTTPLYNMTQSFVVEKDVVGRLTFYDEMTGNFYNEDILKPVIIHANTGAPDVRVAGELGFPGATPGTYDDNGNTVQYYRVDDPKAINVTADLALVSGHFGYPVYACLCGPVDENGNMSILTYAGYPMFFDKSNRETLSTTLNYSAMDQGKPYTVAIAYEFGSSLVPIGPAMAQVCYGVPAGVDDIAVEDDGLTFDGARVACGNDNLRVVVCNLNGNIVAAGNGSVEVGSLAPGVYIARAGGASLKILLR